MTFPTDFCWGVASSSFQVEGSVEADGRQPSIWDTFCKTPGKVFDGHTGEPACGSYADPARDADLIASLGARAYRFSIAWPRVIPSGTGRVNQAGLDYYTRMCDLLLDRSIEPWVTLYHWDLPQALQDRGGWMNREIVGWFEEYATAIVQALGDRVHGYFTLNEPQIFLGLGMVDGEHAPGMKLDRKSVLQATHHALLAHGSAVRVIREHAPAAKVGWVPVGFATAPESDSAADVEAARASTMSIPEDDRWWCNNTWYGDPVVLGHYPEEGLRLFGDDSPEVQSGDMERICQPLDFYSFNLYTGGRCRAAGDGSPQMIAHPAGTPVTMFRWPVCPEAIYWAAKFHSERYELPLYIGENGLASMDWVHADGEVHDPGRIDFLARYLREVKRATDDGIDLRGYFQWSILDNFEWAEGYRMRFGLTYVDFVSGERIKKDSFKWYREVIESNGATLPNDVQPLR